MLIYKTYRNGHKALDKRVALALAHFYKVYHQLPASIAVNGAELLQAQSCETAGVPVVGNGGVLVDEVWLEVANEKTG